MNNSFLPIVLFALLFGASSVVRADVVFLKHEAQLEGHIVKRSESSVEIDIGAGSLTIPMSTVDRIEMGRSVLDDYEDRAAELGAQDRDGWLELARWASGKGLRTQSLDAYARVLTIDPNDPEANRAQGRVEVEGSWMTPEQAYAEKGYVNFEGRWVTPAEQESILRSREAEATAAAQARTAEAQAQEAEARAQEAQANSERSTWGAPLYWNSWGPGPRTWPTNPLDHERWEDSNTQGQP